MTIWYPDLSHFDINRGVHIEPDTVAVIAKATHGALFVDSGYSSLKRQAAAVGAVFGAYHWLNHGNSAAQARYCYSQVGPTPVMVDAEDQPGNSGYTGPLTVQDIVDFVTELRRVGGTVNLVYLPRWYWQNRMGSPDLTPLKNLGLHLVSSNYTAYSDSGPGWAGYGSMTPSVWQYTDALPYGGASCDFNAFKGTVAEFAAMLNASGPTPAPAPPPQPPAPHYPPNIDEIEEQDMWSTGPRTIPPARVVTGPDGAKSYVFDQHDSVSIPPVGFASPGKGNVELCNDTGLDLPPGASTKYRVRLAWPVGADPDGKTLWHTEELTLDNGQAGWSSHLPYMCRGVSVKRVPVDANDIGQVPLTYTITVSPQYP